MQLLILDRDGVINEESDDFIKSADDWRPIPGSLEAIAKLSHSGYRVIVASNQSGLGRGLLDIDALNDIHALFHQQLAELGGHVEAIFFCPHLPEDSCGCRKPKTGMYLDLAARLGVKLTGVYMVGDRLTDVEACLAVQARPVLVRTGRGPEAIASLGDDKDVEIHDSLADFVEKLLSAPVPQET